MHFSLYRGLAAILLAPDGSEISLPTIQTALQAQRTSKFDGLNQSQSHSYLSVQEEYAVMQRLQQHLDHVSSGYDTIYGRGGTDGFGAYNMSNDTWDLTIFQQNLKRGVEQIVKTVLGESSSYVDLTNPDLRSPRSETMSMQKETINRMYTALEELYFSIIGDIQKYKLQSPRPSPQATPTGSVVTPVSTPSHYYGRIPPRFPTQYQNHRVDDVGSRSMSAVSLRNDSFASSQLGSPNPESSVTMDSTGGAHDDAIQKTQLLTEALKPNKTIGRTESPSGLRWTKSLSRRRSKKTLKRAISNPHLVSTTQNLDNTIDLVNLPQSNTLPQKGVTNTSPPLPPLPLPSTKPVSPYQASMQKPLSYDRVAVPQATTEPRGSPLPTSPQLEAQPRISTHSQDSTSKASRMSERTSHSSTNTTRYGAKLGDTSTIRSPNGSFTLENGLHSTPSKPPSQLSKADPAASVPTMAYMADNASDLSFATAANAPPSPMPSAKYSASSPTISHQTPSPRGAHTPVWTTSPNTPTKPPASPPVTNGPPRLLLNELNIDNGSFWNLGEANNVAEKPTPAPSDSHHSTSDPRMTPDSYVGVATTGDSVQTAGPAPVYSHATVATSNSSFSGVPDDLVQAMGSQPYMGADDSMSALLGHLPSHYSTDHASLASTSMRESRIGEVIAFPQENDSHVTHTSPLQLVSPMGEPVSKVEVDLARSGSDATVRGGNHSRKSHDTSVYDIYFSKSRDDDTRSPRKPVADNFKEIHMGSRPITTLYSDVPPQRDMNSMPRVGSTINPIWQVVAGLNDRSSVYSEAEPLAKRMSDLSMLSQREAAPVNNNTSITSLATEQDNRTLFTEARAAKTEFVPIEPLALSSNSARMLEKLHDDERSLSSTEDLEQPELVSGHPSTATTALPSSPPEPTAPTLPKRSSSPIIELNDQGLPVQIVYYNDDELPEIMDKIASGNNSARIEFRRRSAFPEIDAALRKEEEDKQKTESTEDSQFNRVEQSILSLLRPTFSSFGLGSTGTGS